MAVVPLTSVWVHVSMYVCVSYISNKKATQWKALFGGMGYMKADGVLRVLVTSHPFKLNPGVLSSNSYLPLYILSP